MRSSSPHCNAGRLAAAAMALLLAACGPLPHPFEHSRRNPLLDNPALEPVEVAPVQGQPGLAEAVATALDHEEIAASTHGNGRTALRLSGRVEGDGMRRMLVWRLDQADGTMLGETRQPLPHGEAAGPAALGYSTADDAAAAIARLLRGDDGAAAPADTRPRVSLRPIQAPAEFDGAGLRNAMLLSLTAEGFAVTDDRPGFVVEGAVQMAPAGKGKDYLGLTWVVRDTAGKELGTVSQGSPVPHALLVGPSESLDRDIAAAGAEGVAEVIKKAAASNAASNQVK